MANADRIIEIFNEAKDRSAGPERERFLAEACREAADLREQVDSLLQSHEGAGDFLKQPLFAPTGPLTETAGDAIGRYKLLEKIGEGGWGVVYVAEQTEPVRRRVALKVIKLGMDTRQVVARFESERQALAMMEHPNIAKVLEAGSTDLGRPYFVMELVCGLRITDYCNRNHLGTRERLDLFIQVCHAIQHAHQKGIIHRDIKPSNILVTLHDGVPVPKVIDFGIAKATEERLTDATVYTQLHHFIGTPAYMSPEQAEMSGLDIDTRSDIYSLGVLLYELLTGQTPFDGQKLMASGLDAMRKTIREQEPARPSTRLTQELDTLPPGGLSPRKSSAGLAIPSEAEAGADARLRLRLKEQINRVRGDLDWIVMKCMEKDRSRRYATANGLAADLDRHLHNEPVMARPPSVAYRFQKAWQRHKLAFTAAMVLATALLLGISVSTWQAFRARAEKITAQHHLYVARMNLARQAWEEGTFGRLQQLLEETRAFPERGFEWYYWQRQAHLNLLTLRGHLGRVQSAAFAPDGRTIVTGGWDQTARVWDAASGRELFRLIGHSGAVYSVAFSPDGQRIVTGSEDQTARLWDADSGGELRILFRHRWNVLSVAFSPDGKRIVTGHLDRTARFWDAASGRQLPPILPGSGPISSVAFSSDGKQIVTGSWDSTVRVWDAWNPTNLLTFLGHSLGVFAVAFSPDGKQIVTGGNEAAKVWAVNNDRESLELKGKIPGALAAAISPDSRRIVTGGTFMVDGPNNDSGAESADVWETASGKKLAPLTGHRSGISSAAFSPDGLWIVTGSADQSARVWETVSGKESWRLEGHQGPVNSVAFSPNGQRIVTGGQDHTAQVWEVATRRRLFQILGHTDSVTSVGFSWDGARMVTGSLDNTVRVWEAATGREVCKLESPLLTRIQSVAFSRDGKRVVGGGYGGLAVVWEVATRVPFPLLKGDNTPVSSVAFSPDGRRVVTGSYGGIARVWETITGQEMLTLNGHGRVGTSVAFSRDGRRILTGSIDLPARVWEAAGSDQVAAWDAEESVAAHSRAAWRQELAAQLRQQADEEKRHGAPPARLDR